MRPSDAPDLSEAKSGVVDCRTYPIFKNKDREVLFLRHIMKIL